MITVDDMIAEYAVLANREHNKGLTTRELTSLLNWGEVKVRKFLRLGIAAGSIIATKKKIMGISGVEYMASAYIIKRGKHASK
jgi:hypothetical protein